MDHTEHEINIDDLAKFIFMENKDDRLVSITIPLLEDTKELFFFLVDLFCKGLVYLYGDINRVVHLEDLTMEDFNIIKKKMELTGIIVILNVEHLSEKTSPAINLRGLDTMPNNLKLQEYTFTVTTFWSKYSIKFNLKRIGI